MIGLKLLPAACGRSIKKVCTTLPFYWYVYFFSIYLHPVKDIEDSFGLESGASWSWEHKI